MTARDEILSRIQAALGPPASDPAASYAGIARAYNCAGQLTRAACLDLFLDRLRDYDTEVLQVESDAGLPGAIAQALAPDAAHAGDDRALIAPAFPAAWLPPNFTFITDTGLSTSQIEGVPAVVTTCEAAVASTGTIFLAHGDAQGRRILTLLPDHHVCLIRRSQVGEFFPHAVTVIAPQITVPVTMISGPSATSDIEMMRVRGVHGPRRLTAILYGPLEIAPHDRL